MAGHSKWANIKYRKSRADAAKGKVFSRITKEIISAVKQGGPDPKGNTKLKIAIAKAKAANLPSENIERNIKKATSKDQGDFFEITYELYGHGGVGILAEVMTDNKNRIASDMRIATNKKGGNVATPGAVSFNFDQKGIIQVAKSLAKEEDLFLLATDAGAQDFDQNEEFFMIITAPEDLYRVKEALEAQNITLEDASLEKIPKSSIDCNEEDKAANLALIDYLESLDDVDVVYHNMNL